MGSAYHAWEVHPRSIPRWAGFYAYLPQTAHRNNSMRRDLVSLKSDGFSRAAFLCSGFYWGQSSFFSLLFAYLWLILAIQVDIWTQMLVNSCIQTSFRLRVLQSAPCNNVLFNAIFAIFCFVIVHFSCDEPLHWWNINWSLFWRAAKHGELLSCSTLGACWQFHCIFISVFFCVLNLLIFSRRSYVMKALCDHSDLPSWSYFGRLSSLSLLVDTTSQLPSVALRYFRKDKIWLFWVAKVK